MKLTCHACIQALTTSADYFARHLEETIEDISRDTDEPLVEEDLYFSINDDSESSITDDFASKPIAVSKNNAKHA